MNKDDALKMLQDLRARGCHLLIPTTQHVASLSDQFEIIVESVRLSGHPKDRDVYPHETSAYNYQGGDWKNPAQAKAQTVRLTKHGLEKLNILAGIMWSPSLCREICDPNVPGRIAYEAVGGVRKPDGTPYFISKIYAMDIEVERQKLESLYAKKDASTREYCVTRDLLQKKSNQATLCESGAKNRVTREILNLKNFYTVEEMDREFVMARIVPKLDLKDEYTKRRLIDLQLQALTGIYGVPSAPSVPPRQAIEYAAPIDIKVVEESSQDDEPPAADPEPAPPAAKPEKAEPEKQAAAPDPRATAFEKSDTDKQCQLITDRALVVGYVLGDYMARAKKNTLADFTPAGRLGLYKHILAMPAKPAAQPDDIPY